VQMRSRKKRSCEITTTQPATSISASFSAQGLDVAVVGRFVEQEDVAAGFQVLPSFHRDGSHPAACWGHVSVLADQTALPERTTGAIRRKQR